MNNAPEIFKPGIAELQKMALRLKDLRIRGLENGSLEDIEGYNEMKLARKELAEMRIMITKFGKKERESAIAYQKEVIRQEREHLDIITPLEISMKQDMELFDSMKKREERRILLPTRMEMLKELGVEMSEDVLLDYDEEGFAVFYTGQMALQAEANKRKEEEAQTEEARKIQAEKEKQEAVAKAIEDERLRVENEKKLAEEEEAIRIKREAYEKEQTEKLAVYQQWLADNGYNEETKEEFYIGKIDDTFILWKEVSRLKI